MAPDYLTFPRPVLLGWIVLCADLALQDAVDQLPVWEWAHPGDARPRLALDAARSVLHHVRDGAYLGADAAYERAARLVVLLESDYAHPAPHVPGPIPVFAAALHAVGLARDALLAADEVAMASLAEQVAQASAQAHAAAVLAFKSSNLRVTRNGALTRRLTWCWGLLPRG